uniref:Uncharacterized protein n=1 Tax=Oryctolagus cuniculus TaxID=9986 RepID=A0A5F9D2P7_RABIT
MKTGSLTSNAAWGSSSITASGKVWATLLGKERLKQGSLTKEKKIKRNATHLWAAAGPPAAAAIPDSRCCCYRGYRSAAAQGGNFWRNTNRASVLSSQRAATQRAARGGEATSSAGLAGKVEDPFCGPDPRSRDQLSQSRPSQPCLRRPQLSSLPSRPSRALRMRSNSLQEH